MFFARRSGRLAFVALVLLVPWPLLLATSDAGSEPEPPPPPASTDLAVILMRTELDAETLCAAGISAQEVGALIAPLEAHVDASPGALPGLDAAYAQARTERDRLRRLVRSGLGSAADVNALAQAEQDLAGATTARDAFFADLWGLLLPAVSALEATTLTTIRDHRVWKLPTEYLVTDRSQADWVELRDALAVRRIHENHGEPFPQETQLYLATIEADLGVAAAAVNLDTNLAAVQAAWNQAVSD